MGSILKNTTLPRKRSFTQPVAFRRRSEENEQVQACNWLRKTYPQVIFFSDCVGMKMSDTMRINVMKMRSGDGIPDIHIMFPSRGYHGLVIEFKPTGFVLKNKDGTLRKASYTRKYKRNGQIWIKRGDHNEDQTAMLEKYNKLGYLARYAIGLEAFQKLVNWYMENEQQSLF